MQQDFVIYDNTIIIYDNTLSDFLVFIPFPFLF